MADGKIEEMQDYVTAWADKTDRILLDMLKRLGIGVTDELFNSVRSKVYKQAGDMIGYELSFFLYGRFRDMNVGRGRGKSLSHKIETTATNREIIKRKSRGKATRWFARPFYGRLGALHSAIGYSMMEEAVNSIKKPMQDA